MYNFNNICANAVSWPLEIFITIFLIHSPMADVAKRFWNFGPFMHIYTLYSNMSTWQTAKTLNDILQIA